MGLFDRLIEKKSSKKMTKEQKFKQNYAIINYYKKKNNESTCTYGKHETQSEIINKKK